jgi:MFS family permease
MPDPDPKPAYEAPDDQRPASASPTEPVLEAAPIGAAPSKGHDPYAALRLRDYRLFVISGFFTVIAGQIMSTTALYEVYLKTKSAMNLGWVGGVMAVPMLLLALPAGHFADTHSRRRTVITALTISALCGVALAMLSRSEPQYSVYPMYVVLAFNSTIATFGRPARQAMMPQLVPPEIFSNAVTWNTTVFEVAAMSGPAIGGFLSAYSIPQAYLLAAACWGASAVMLFALPERGIMPGNGRRGFADLVAGLRFVFSTRLMLSAMTLDLLAVLLGGATYMLPAVATDVLHVSSTKYGWLRAAPAIGAFCMAIILSHLPPMKRAGRTLLLAVAGFGLATIVFGLSRSFELSMAMLIALGMCDNISVVVRHTVIQMLTPDSMRGRVSAVNQVFIGSSNEIGGFESGVTARWFGLVPSIVIGGIGTIVVVIGSAIGFPELRRLGSLKDIRPREPDQEDRGFEVVQVTGEKSNAS